MSNQIRSLSVSIGPVDRRCRYWAKIIRAGTGLSLPDHVLSATDVPGAYLRTGDEELLPGDALIEGEENHHRKNQGWRYQITICWPDGSGNTIVPDSATKANLKSQGLDPEYLKGAGGIAACVRVLHAWRQGLFVTQEDL